MKFRVTATMHTDLEGIFEADSLEQMEEMVQNGYIDGGDMTADGDGGWTWLDVTLVSGSPKEMRNGTNQITSTKKN
jgi:hypothetical protein